MIEDHPLLAPARWRLPHSTSAALRTTITPRERQEIDRDSQLRRTLECLLRRFIALDVGIEQLQFMDDRGVVEVELACRGTGEFHWRFAFAVAGTALG